MSQHPFLLTILKSVVVSLLRATVTIYTYTTLPLYYWAQDVASVVKKGGEVRSVQLDPRDPHSAWTVAKWQPYRCVVDVSTTLDDMISKLGQFYSLKLPALGYRSVLCEHIVMGSDGVTPLRIDGRTVKKRELSHYKWITYEQMIERRRHLALGFHLAGLEQGDHFVILCETSAEYFLTQLAIANAGAVQVNVFTTLGDSGIAHALCETKATYMLVSYDLLAKVRGIVEGHDTSLRTVFYVKPRVATADSELTPLTTTLKGVTFVAMDEAEEEGRLRGHLVAEKCVARAPEEIGFVIYTSGTTGVPKGVQVTSGAMINLLHAILPVLAHIMYVRRHIYVAYLPQAHIFEATCELLAIVFSTPIGFAHPFTLTDSSHGLAPGQMSDLRLLKPTIMIAVPLVLERMRKEIFAKLESRSPISSTVFNYLMDYKIYWTQKGYKTPIVNKLLCAKVREQFGGRLEKLILGGAPLSATLQSLIKAALEVTLVQGYGMTETVGAALCMDDDDLTYGRCGRPLRGILARLDDWAEGGYQVTDKPRPRGELIIGSRCNSHSYLNLPEMNADHYQSESDITWFKTGDIAEVYEDGTFAIIDRKKDLVKLANGEYFSLGKIESALKNSSYVDNICVIGNALTNNLVALVLPNQKRFERLLTQLNLDKSEAIGDGRVNTIVLRSLQETAARNGLKRAEVPTRIRLVEDEWTPDNDLMTAALKLKRSSIKAKYDSVIVDLFKA